MYFLCDNITNETTYIFILFDVVDVQIYVFFIKPDIISEWTFFRVKTVSAMFGFDQFEISFLNKMYKIYREKTKTIKLFVCLLGNRKERNRKTTKTLDCIISCQMRKKVETF